MQPAKLWTRLDPELVDQRVPGILIGSQCLGSLPAPVFREHQLIPEFLPQ